METNNIIYTNGFRITISPIEMQLILALETPIIDEETGKITEVKSVNIADIRMNSTLARELRDKLIDQFNAIDNNIEISDT